MSARPKDRLAPPAAYGIHNRAELLSSGAAYFDRMGSLIDQARRTIHLQVYIFADDRTAERMINALIRAAQRGVQVFVITDGFASQQFPEAWIEALRHAGGHFRWFEPLFRSRFFYIGRRSHHKVLVVDHRYALVSGRNIADRYTDTPDEPGWRDMAIDLEGEAAIDLARICCTVWNGAGHRTRRERAQPPTEQDRAELIKTWPNGQRCKLRVRFNDWLFRRAEVAASYAELLRTAEKEVWLVSSYFVPGRALKRQMAGAVRRGVRLRVITAGRSDVWIAKPAERWLYAWLLRHGMEVYEYNRTVLHAKLGLRDGVWCTLGSFNLNDLSAYTTLEVNVDVDDPQLVPALNSELERMAREDCHRITAADERQAGAFTRLGRWAAYEALRTIHFMLTFYYHRAD